MDLNEIEQLTKGRKELEKLESDKKKLVEQIDLELLKLNTASGEFQQILKDKEIFLFKREKESLDRLSKSNNQLIEVNEVVGDIFKSIDQFIEKAIVVSEKAISITENSVGQADKLVNKAENLQRIWEAGLESIKQNIKHSEELIIKNSEFNKQLQKKDKEIELKSKVADQKLQEAKDLVFWHDNKKGEKISI